MKSMLLAALMLCAVLVLLPHNASASYITYTGTTAGCFGVGCTPSASESEDGIKGLFFTPNTVMFTCTTDSTGFCAVGDTAPPNSAGPGVSPTGDNFGYFSLNGTTNTYTGDSFTLEITFTNPTVSGGNANGGKSETFTSALHGSINSTQGGVSIMYASPAANLTGDCTSTSGTGCYTSTTAPGPYNTSYPFTLTLSNNVSIVNPNAAGTTYSNLAQTGNIQDQASSTVPDPGSLFLITSGLLVTLVSGRRLRKS